MGIGGRVPPLLVPEMLSRQVGPRVAGTGEHQLIRALDPPPANVCYLGPPRWDVEKVFDEFKNHLDTKRSWTQALLAKIYATS